MSKTYDSTVARIAGNIASGVVNSESDLSVVDETFLALFSVRLARAIVAETVRTEPPASLAAVDPVVRSGQEGATRA